MLNLHHNVERKQRKGAEDFRKPLLYGAKTDDD